MTLAQIRLFTEAIDYTSKRDMQNAVVTALAGAKYDEKALKKLFKDLT